VARHIALSFVALALEHSGATVTFGRAMSAAAVV